MRWLNARLLVLFAVALLSSAFSTNAKVTRVEIISRSDIADGKSFGLAGPYEKIVGRVYFTVDPANPHNQQIVDIAKADRNAQGQVEFSADLFLLRPKDLDKGNGAALFEVSNRGGKGIESIVDGASAGHEYGDGFLMRHGYTIAWVGWEFDVADEGDRLKLYAPVAHDPGGKEIHGLVRSDFTPAKRVDDMPLGHSLLGPNGGKSYPVDDPASAKNVLTVRDAPEAPRTTIPRNQWTFAHTVDGKLVNDPHFIHLDGGFQAGKIYEVVYEAKNPVVVGLGLASVRDFLSYLKYDPQAPAPVKRIYATGISQSGRFLRHFLWQNFNADEQGRQVMDGVIAHVAGAGRGSFNHRFAQPSRDAQPLSSIDFPTDIFPFTDLPETDPVTGETAGLFDAVNKAHDAPKIFLTNTSYEYWGRAAALVTVSPDGESDVQIGDNVRVYLLAGLQHFSAGFPPQKSSPNSPDSTAQQRYNPNPVQFFWRALITDMDDWVKSNTEPPPSRYPKISDHTLVPLDKWDFPAIPGVNKPHEANAGWHLDFGPQWKQGIVTNEPPKIGKPFPVLVPQSDPNGNDEGGVSLPELQVPLATYTGWNLRDLSIGLSDLRLSFYGSFIPFPKTEADRAQTGDPRFSIAGRYKSRDEYLGKFSEAELKLVQDRFLLKEDMPALLERGKREWDEVVGQK
ncbi:MAG TPA: alpha/beta hydrolase domain-containing protein [Candidatus Bathyarchaeia archaeon]|nr:alpha/beta hydrolase domain-containing protein [Candidatus Bathyarchaeia archaeon]